MVSLLESEGLDLNATSFPGNMTPILAVRDGDEGIAGMELGQSRHSGWEYPGTTRTSWFIWPWGVMTTLLGSIRSVPR